MKVSLISTVKDAGPEHVREFLDSLRAQTRPPDETIIVDGGSTDGTLEVLEQATNLTVISEPGANISRGRNVAIAAAAHDVIAATDADCTLAPDWLERLLVPIEDGADVRGYFHWSNTDNFEWARGYAAHFGLIGVDRKTLERTVKPSGRLYARIATANGLD